MKLFSTRSIGFVVIVGLVIAGCSSSGSPANVVKRYYAALAKGDSKALAAVMTPSGAENLTPFMEKAQSHVTSMGEIKSTVETINGDTGSVAVTFADGTTEEISVAKIGGKWKVSEWE
jgi:ketosteroid isomerase-like protein